MASVNNMFITDTPPYRIYRKTITSAVGGFRFAMDTKNPVSFFLQTDENDPFSDKLFVYSELEDAYVRRVNQKLFTEGYLVLELKEDQKAVAREKSPAVFKKKVQGFTKDELHALLHEPLSEAQRSYVESLITQE